MSTITASIAREAAVGRQGWEDPAVRRLVGHCLLDWLACTVAGVDEPPARIATAAALEQGAAPAATIVGSPAGSSLQLAAHANGVISHALDFDDANLSIPGHPGVVLFPGLLALAEARHCSGRALADAFLAGYEAACRIGTLVAPSHYALGFHATGTIGTFGAAAACGRLLGMDEARMRHAIGIAATQASGLIAMFGTGTKPLHAGNAAAAGLGAALLADKGLTAREDALECAQGFAATHAQGMNAQAALASPLLPGLQHPIQANLFKYHAACYGTHATLECARTIRTGNAAPGATIRSIHLEVGEECTRTCDIASPRTGAEAKFSLRFNAAAGLLGLPTGALATYCEAACRDPAITDLMSRTEVAFVPGRPLTIAGMRVTYEDGHVAQAEADSGRPLSDLAAQERLLLQKFDALAGPRLAPDAARALREDALDLDRVADVARMMHWLRCGLPQHALSAPDS